MASAASRRTLEAVLLAALAVGAAAVAGDILAASSAERPAAHPWTLSNGTVTAIGLRITGAGERDLVRVPLDPAIACGSLVAGLAFADGRVVATESHATAALLAGEVDDPDYGTLAPDGCTPTGAVRLHRGPHGPADTLPPGLRPYPHGPDSDNLAAALADFPRDGIDVYYVLGAADARIATGDGGSAPGGYANLSAALLARQEDWWLHVLAEGSVEPHRAGEAHRALQAVAAASGIAFAAAAAALLARREPPAPAGPLEAAAALAQAGEGNLVRLRNAWRLLGVALAAALALATGLAAALLAGGAPPAQPVPSWATATLAGVVALDAAALAAWALAFRKVRRDLASWRRAWAAFEDGAGRDGL